MKNKLVLFFLVQSFFIFGLVNPKSSSADALEKREYKFVIKEQNKETKCFVLKELCVGGVIRTTKKKSENGVVVQSEITEVTDPFAVTFCSFAKAFFDFMKKNGALLKNIESSDFVKDLQKDIPTTIESIDDLISFFLEKYKKYNKNEKDELNKFLLAMLAYQLYAEGVDQKAVLLKYCVESAPVFTSARYSILHMFVCMKQFEPDSLKFSIEKIAAVTNASLDVKDASGKTPLELQEFLKKIDDLLTVEEPLSNDPFFVDAQDKMKEKRA